MVIHCGKNVGEEEEGVCDGEIKNIIGRTCDKSKPF